MVERLARLLAVQAMDMDLAAMQERRAEVPRRRVDVTREITALETERNAHASGLEKARLARRAREGDLELVRERLAKYERQLNEVKTNVAYSALLSEIQGAKREIGQTEDEILGFMAEIEDHEKRIAELDAALVQKRADAADELASLAAEESELARAVEAQTSRRDILAAEVDRSLYRLYDRLRRHQRFPALVPLRGSACGACHSALPPQVIREIMLGSFHPCEACGVLVYSAPEGQPAATSDRAAP